MWNILFFIVLLNLCDLHASDISATEDLEVIVKEYSTALVTISWIDEQKNVLHTETSEMGRFSTGGPAKIGGILSIPDLGTSKTGCDPTLGFSSNQV